MELYAYEVPVGTVWNKGSESVIDGLKVIASPEAGVPDAETSVIEPVESTLSTVTAISLSGDNAPRTDPLIRT